MAFGSQCDADLSFRIWLTLLRKSNLPQLDFEEHNLPQLTCGEPLAPTYFLNENAGSRMANRTDRAGFSVNSADSFDRFDLALERICIVQHLVALATLSAERFAYKLGSAFNQSACVMFGFLGRAMSLSEEPESQFCLDGFGDAQSSAQRSNSASSSQSQLGSS